MVSLWQNAAQQVYPAQQNPWAWVSQLQQLQQPQPIQPLAQPQPLPPLVRVDDAQQVQEQPEVIAGNAEQRQGSWNVLRYARKLQVNDAANFQQQILETPLEASTSNTYNKDAKLMQSFSDIKLNESKLEQVANEIRNWMNKNFLRVRDALMQMDDDGNGLVDRAEFAKALHELGVEGSDEVFGALFRGLDSDGNKAIDYRELRTLLGRSYASHPQLSPLLTKLRTSHRKKVEGSRILQGVDVDLRYGPEFVADQIRELMEANILRVIDVFRQLDQVRSQ